MIDRINISNFAIIENTEVEFEDGLNIITGETGSGKSIVIEAISLALGSRADSSLVRHGCKKAIIQLLCTLEGEEYLITREISATGKNVCKLNGELVTLGELSKVCSRIADIHGQYDNQSLLNTDNHIKLVDEYHKDIISPAKGEYAKSFDEYKKKRAQLKKLLDAESSNSRKLDFYKYEKSEIENANLSVGEDDDLEDRISLLQNSEKIFSGAEGAYDAISGETSALSLVGHAMNMIQSISEYSKDLEELSEEITDIYYRLEDFSSNLRNLCDGITFTPDELDNSIARINLIDNLKKKYGATIEDILQYCDNISAELNQIENFDEEKARLEKEEKEAFEVLKTKGSKLTQLRKDSAKELAEKMEKELHDLNFNDARLEISFKETSSPEENGLDIVEILIASNKGEPLKPLAKTASGGEISRIMLAIKNITGTYDNIPTMIFDEIDTGISGLTASVVGKKLREISKTHQIICITHLPQIAAMSDQSYKIFKESNNDATFTYVNQLTEEEKIDELARLLGGEVITDTTRQNARELIEASRQVI